MTKRRILFFFLMSGLILAAVIGVSVYQSHIGPSEEEVTAVLTTFIDRIRIGDMNGARNMLTEETRSLLRDSGTSLGRSVYRNLSLKSADNVMEEDKDVFRVEVILNAPDTLKIMAAAGIMFGERIVENGPEEDADGLMEAIYDEILSRNDLPMMDHFCAVRLELRDGRLQIRADEALQQALEGDSLSNSELLMKMGD